MRAHRLTLKTEEELRQQMLQVGPVVQQAIQDGRSIEVAIRSYFPDETAQKALSAVYQAALLCVVLDKSLKDGFLSDILHQELLRFLYELVGRAD